MVTYTNKQMEVRKSMRIGQNEKQSKWHNRIICGDCEDKMKHYVLPGSVNLIYLDPPFSWDKKYKTIWNDGYEITPFNDVKTYVEWLKPRLKECHKALRRSGSIYVHSNYRTVHYVKVIMDDIFGYDNFQNEIIWNYGLGGSSPKRYSRKHDTILFYSKSDNFVFDPPMVKTTSQKMKGQLKKEDDVWDIPNINNMAKERRNYLTQKPEALLERIIKASSNKDDIILDPFCGGGTSVFVAQKLDRRWMGIDISPEACKETRDRVCEIGHVNYEMLDLP